MVTPSIVTFIVSITAGSARLFITAIGIDINQRFMNNLTKNNIITILFILLSSIALVVLLNYIFSKFNDSENPLETSLIIGLIH